jgi:hypothetical protein
MHTTINFLADVPRLGTSFNVKEPLNEVTRKYITAQRFGHATIEFTKPDGNTVIIPFSLIGPIEGTKQEAKDDE